MERCCPVCRGAEPATFFELRGVPVFCNVLHDTPRAAQSAPRGDMRLAFCRGCTAIVNTAFDPALAVYPPGYETSLHASAVFAGHARELADGLVARYDLRGKDVLEIGCGRGDFLALLCAHGRNRGVGFDAAQTGTAPAAGIAVVPRAFTAADAARGADLIVCRHVLEHAADPRAFAELLRRATAARPGAALFVEVPNALFTLRDLGIWDLIYEHVSYLTPPALKRLLEEVGLRVQALYTLFGDQFLCAEARAEAAPGAADAAAGRDEIEALVRTFAARHAAKRRAWEERLRRAHRSAQRVALWGAGSKGITFLSTVPGADRIAAVVDQSAHKQGRWVPGTAHRVVAPDALRAHPPDLVLVANPVYLGEIGDRLTALGLHPELAAL